MSNIKNLNPYAALYGPRDDHWTEPDWEAMELSDRALQGLSQTLSEEGS